MNSTSSIPLGHTLHAMIEQFCVLACNPSGLQQRLVKGGRNSKKYEKRMIQHKQDCITGCRFAVQSDIMLDTPDQKHIHSTIKNLREDSSKILSTYEIRQQRHLVEDWFSIMRDNCSKKCEEKFDASGQYKRLRSCAAGCEQFFSAVMSK
eukprot:gene4165-8473_t